MQEGTKLENEPGFGTEKKKIQLRSIIALAVAFAGISACCIVTMFYASDVHNKNVALMEVIEECHEIKGECAETTVELTTLKKRLVGIKNQDDLLRRDIEYYIKARFKKTSKVVARAIAENVVEKAKTEDVSPELVIGIIEVESAFNPAAVGPKTKYGHARGLMQVMSTQWVKHFNLEDKYVLHNIDVNIDTGIKVFKIHLEEGKGKISQGLYLYVNKDKKYVDDVYKAMGRFVSFRSTVDDKNKTDNGDESKEGETPPENETDETAKPAVKTPVGPINH